MQLSRKIILAVLALTTLTIIATPAFAAANNVKSVDWTYQIVSNGPNYWLACATTTNNRTPSNQAYTFQYPVTGYTQSGTTDAQGCFTVLESNVGTGFGYGSSYQLRVASGPTQSFVVTTARTLGAQIVGPRSGLLLLVQTVNLVAIVATAIVVGGLGVYLLAKKQSN